jgi:ATP-dependent DNA helicase RecG
LRREEIPDYPEVALREAVINAVCHRDYFDKRANVLIEVFADRVVITNPGGLPSGLPPEEFGTRSVARNPLIASLLHRIDYIEKIGTGINRIRQAVAEHGGTELDLRYNDFFTATFRAKVTMEPGGAIGEQVGEQVARVLIACNTRPQSKAELLEAIGLANVYLNYKRHLVPLIEQGIIEMTIPDKPQSRLQKYRLTAKGRALLNKEGGDE